MFHAEAESVTRGEYVTYREHHVTRHPDLSVLYVKPGYDIVTDYPLAGKEVHVPHPYLAGMARLLQRIVQSAPQDSHNINFAVHAFLQ